MAKIVLNTISSLRTDSALEALEENFDGIAAELENTLSRDGTAPNSMGADLDMNNHRIYNLPTPTSATEPARLTDLEDLAITITLDGDGVPLATQIEAVAGVVNDKFMSPLRVKQANQESTDVVRTAETDLQTVTSGLKVNYIQEDYGVLNLSKFITSNSPTSIQTVGIQDAADVFMNETNYKILQGTGRRHHIDSTIFLRQETGTNIANQGKGLRDIFLFANSAMDVNLPMVEFHDPFNVCSQGFIENCWLEDTTGALIGGLRQQQGFVFSNFYGFEVRNCGTLGLHGIHMDERRTIYSTIENTVWATNTVYNVGETVTSGAGTKEYTCIKSHRSGADIDTDTANGKWARCMGAWSSGSAYVIGDTVESAGAGYYCYLAVGPSATAPASDTAHWVRNWFKPSTVDVFVRTAGGNHGFRVNGLYNKCHLTSDVVATRTAIGLRLGSPDWSVQGHDCQWPRQAFVARTGSGRYWNFHHSMGEVSFISDAIEFQKPNAISIAGEIDIGGCTIKGFGGPVDDGITDEFNDIYLELNAQTDLWTDAAKETFLHIIPGVVGTEINNFRGYVYGLNTAGGTKDPIACTFGEGPASDGAFSENNIFGTQLFGGGKGCRTVSTQPKAKFGPHAGGAGSAGVFTCDLSSRMITDSEGTPTFLGALKSVQVTPELSVAGAMAAQVRSMTTSEVKVQIGAAATGPSASTIIYVSGDINSEDNILIDTVGTT